MDATLFSASFRAERDKTKAAVHFEYPAEISLFGMNTAQGERGECELLRLRH